MTSLSPFLFVLISIPKNSPGFFRRFTIRVFSIETSRSRRFLSHSATPYSVFSASPFVAHIIRTSSAYRMMCISFRLVFRISRKELPLLKVPFGATPPFHLYASGFSPHWLSICQSNSLRTILASNGEIIPPCGVPFVGVKIVPSGISIFAFSIFLIMQISCLSLIPIAQICLISLV